MNANELADKLSIMVPENICLDTPVLDEAATTLRAQQAEIEALKEALRMKVILNEHAKKAMKGYKELLK